MSYPEQGNRSYLSISTVGSDTPVTRPETDKAGQSPRGRKGGGGGGGGGGGEGKVKCY